MTTFYLIRHALCDEVGRKLAGRMPGVHLNAEGRVQAKRLGERLSGLPLRAVFTSPLDRATETAAEIAWHHGLEYRLLPALNEIETGQWTGSDFAMLSGSDRWRDYNAFRSSVRIPSGELMLEAQLRIIAAMEELRDEYPFDAVALISHADIIKSAVAHYSGVHLDLFHRIEISPASVTIISVDDSCAHILCVNNTEPITIT